MDRFQVFILNFAFWNKILLKYRIIYIPFLLFSTKDVHYQMKLNLRNPQLYFVRKCIFSQVRKQYSLETFFWCILLFILIVCDV